jgi:hypothetical protein
MWSHRGANEAPLPAAKTRGRHHVVPPPGRRAPLPRAAEGRRTRGIHQAAADEAPLSYAGVFFSKNASCWLSKKSEKFDPSFNFLYQYMNTSMYFRADGRTSLCCE